MDTQNTHTQTLLQIYIYRESSKWSKKLSTTFFILPVSYGLEDVFYTTVIFTQKDLLRRASLLQQLFSRSIFLFHSPTHTHTNSLVLLLSFAYSFTAWGLLFLQRPRLPTSFHLCVFRSYSQSILHAKSHWKNPLKYYQHIFGRMKMCNYFHQPTSSTYSISVSAFLHFPECLMMKPKKNRCELDALSV